MSATTVNAFPPLHAFNSSRGWFLALIVLLHAGFFWVLTHGVTIGSVKHRAAADRRFPARHGQAAAAAEAAADRRADRQRVVRARHRPARRCRRSTIRRRHRSVTRDPPPVPREVVTEKPGAGPLIVEPQGDPRFPFTEPEYPVSEIRHGARRHGVAVDRDPAERARRRWCASISRAAIAKLDDSAVREARRWRMKPGMQDGVATAMWKRVPITFQLKN